MIRKCLLILGLIGVVLGPLKAAYILLPMEHDKQKDHLKAYGITYWVLNKNVEAWWLLNYRGGSFAFEHNKAFEKECLTRGVSYEIVPDAQFNGILDQIADPAANMEAMKLEKAPKVAVYSPEVDASGKSVQPWDDAVTLVLTYAEIPFDMLYDREVMGDKLAQYDWLHLHHEDFTGQHGRNHRGYRSNSWYEESKLRSEELSRSLGFNKVSECKLAVVKKIRDFVAAGGFMFAMCSATDTYDIALAADGVDICAEIFDGDPEDPQAQSKIDFNKTFAFKNFTLASSPFERAFSNIDVGRMGRNVSPDQDYFSLFDFSAKWDPVPSILTQCHTRTVKGFMGQTTAFKKQYLKTNVLILGENKVHDEARYIHGIFGKGFWTFYGGHDPEDYRHRIEDPETDLSLHPNSPGYRLILNNILFPAAKKKERKT
ncbi:asparagine synthetase B [Haliscomenobacter sp.]|uniref:asparagine synthetase B n=1 Tax=Haliscomenobacter sp. TaxID=2717303 RepID=UPI0035938AFC